MFICLSDLSALFKDLKQGKETFGGRIGINTIRAQEGRWLPMDWQETVK